MILLVLMKKKSVVDTRSIFKEGCLWMSASVFACASGCVPVRLPVSVRLEGLKVNSHGRRDGRPDGQSDKYIPGNREGQKGSDVK